MATVCIFEVVFLLFNPEIILIKIKKFYKKLYDNNNSNRFVGEEMCINGNIWLILIPYSLIPTFDAVNSEVTKT
jgi:hypothetical protein